MVRGISTFLFMFSFFKQFSFFILLLPLKDTHFTEKNKSNIDFAPICSVVNLDRGTFFLVKQHLVENPETPPADLVVVRIRNI